MNLIRPSLPLVCPVCKVGSLQDEPDTLVCKAHHCAARHPIVDGVALLLEDFAAYAASERWMVLRRRDLPAPTLAMLDRALAPDSAERVREQMLHCYRNTWQFPELECITAAFGDFVTSALHAHARRVETAVDLGCAAGSHTPWLAPYANAVAGVDLHFERVRAAHEDHDLDKVRFLVANAEDPPFADASIGLVLWLNLLDSIARPRLALQGLLRILEPGGLVVFSSPFTYSSAVSDPGEWVDEAEFDDFVRQHFDVLVQAERLPWVVPAGPTRADVFFTRAALLRKRC